MSSLTKLLRPVAAALAVAATAVAVAKRRRARRDGGVWRDATSDTSR